MLLDIGDVDEAIRQFNTVLQREPNHAVALTLLAQAYRFKELYPQSIEAARKAIQINPQDRRAAPVAGRQPARSAASSPRPSRSTSSI